MQTFPLGFQLYNIHVIHIKAPQTLKKQTNKEISKTSLCNFLSHNSDLCTWACSFLKTVLLLKIMWMWLTSGRLPVEIVCKISSLTFRQNLNGEIVVLYIPHPSRMGTQTHYKQNSQKISVELYLVVVLKINTSLENCLFILENCEVLSGPLSAGQHKLLSCC